ncbi:DinB family protein [Paenibacillus sp. Leaf72]|uniref:DinB family protein n=1 Tax=Paenibacillus sp. Leaf72 TaxID=1736234 RepID=UPI0006F1F3CE|nr:DinB family protein [Paenibacillus sp. Leaf72]KQN98992.1 damage-inducible protein DinB [Paenibacillus sp. Leaf72]
MSGTFAVRDHLLEELELSVRTSCTLIAQIQPTQWDFRPQDNMRSLMELVHHLVAIPATDLAILQERTEQEVAEVENGAAGITSPDELIQRFQANLELFKQYILSLSEDELLTKSSKAYYLEHGMVQVKWLIEVTTHTFHHRSQLYNYLKQNGHDLNFFMLYM